MSKTVPSFLRKQEDVLTAHIKSIMRHTCVPHSPLTRMSNGCCSERCSAPTGAKAVVNDALRVGLGAQGKTVRLPPFKVEPHAFHFKPGVDVDRLNQLVDELEAEALSRKLER